MLTTTAILNLLTAMTTFATVAIEKMSAEQVQGFVERHEQRIDWLRGLLDRKDGPA